MERSRQVSKDNDVVRDTTLRSDVSKRSMGDELSLYIEDDITLGEHFSINPGLRLSRRESLFLSGTEAVNEDDNGQGLGCQAVLFPHVAIRSPAGFRKHQHAE